MIDNQIHLTAPARAINVVPNGGAVMVTLGDFFSSPGLPMQFLPLTNCVIQVSNVVAVNNVVAGGVSQQWCREVNGGSYVGPLSLLLEPVALVRRWDVSVFSCCQRGTSVCACTNSIGVGGVGCSVAWYPPCFRPRVPGVNVMFVCVCTL